jgi:glucarate dehydratase
MAWSLSSARHILRSIEPYNVRNYEDPVATFDEMASCDSIARSLSGLTPDLRSAVRLGVPDTSVLNLAARGDRADTEVHRGL